MDSLNNNPLRRSLALAHLVAIEQRILQNYRTDALALSTDRTNCLLIRGAVQWVRNDHTWQELPWSLRVRVRIPMSLISRQHTFQAMVNQTNRVKDQLGLHYSGRLPKAYWNLLDVATTIEQHAYRERGIQICAQIRRYFAGKEGLPDLTFWTQLYELEQTAYTVNVAAKLYREAFTMRYLRLLEIAKEQLTSDTEVVRKSHSN